MEPQDPILETPEPTEPDSRRSSPEAPGSPLADEPVADKTAESRERCTNCGKKMAKKGDYCPHCGQKRFTGVVRFRSLLGKFFYKLTNLDSKALRMTGLVLVPSRVTQDYFAGKIKRYPHPFQFFFIVMFLFLLVFSRVVDLANQAQIKINTDEIGFSKRSTIAGNNPASNQQEASSSSKPVELFFLMQRQVFGQQIIEAYPKLPPHLRTPVVREALDSAVILANGPWLNSIQKALEVPFARDSLPLQLFNQQRLIAFRDLVERSPEEILAHYQIDYWLEKIAIKQGIKSIQSPANLMNAYLGSISWTILALIACMAMWMKLLYWRRRRYFTEHFIFLLHWHSGAFLLLTMMVLISQWWNTAWLWGGGGLLLAAHLLLAFKFFYGQSWIKSILKASIFAFVYLIGFAFIFTGSILLVFAIF